MRFKYKRGHQNFPFYPQQRHPKEDHFRDRNSSKPVLLADQCVEKATLSPLLKKFQIVTAHQEGMKKADDSTLLKHAAQKGWMVITYDHHFADPNKLKVYDWSAIIILPSQTNRRNFSLRLLHASFQHICTLSCLTLCRNTILHYHANGEVSIRVPSLLRPDKLSRANSIYWTPKA